MKLYVITYYSCMCLMMALTVCTLNEPVWVLLFVTARSFISWTCHNTCGSFPPADNRLTSIICYLNISVYETIICNFHIISSRLISRVNIIGTFLTFLKHFQHDFRDNFVTVHTVTGRRWQGVALCPHQHTHCWARWLLGEAEVPRWPNP